MKNGDFPWLCKRLPEGTSPWWFEGGDCGDCGFRARELPPVNIVEKDVENTHHF